MSADAQASSWPDRRVGRRRGFSPTPACALPCQAVRMNPRALIATAAAIMALLAVMLIALPDRSAPPQASSQKPALTRGQREVGRALVVGLGAEYSQVTCRPDDWEYHCSSRITCYLDE